VQNGSISALNKHEGKSYGREGAESFKNALLRCGRARPQIYTGTKVAESWPSVEGGRSRNLEEARPDMCDRTRGLKFQGKQPSRHWGHQTQAKNKKTTSIRGQRTAGRNTVPAQTHLQTASLAKGGGRIMSRETVNELEGRRRQ